MKKGAAFGYAKILKKMNILLDGRQKAKMGGIIVLMFIGALLEACSIGLVIPVIQTLWTRKR